MMSKVIAFPEPKLRRTNLPAGSAGPVTLFVHVKRTTLIAHLTGRVPATVSRDERLGKR